MRSDILIANTYFLHFDPKQLKLMQPYPPLATLYAASLLRENNIAVELFDTVFAKSVSEIFPAIEKHKNGIFIICDDGFNYLTKMCLVNMREACFEMIRNAKQNNCTVIISSSDATDHFQEYLETGADFIVIGEAEITILELVQSLLNNESSQQQIKGLGFIENGIAVKTNSREVLHNLDDLPFPAWDLVNMDLYKNKWLKKNGYFSLNLTTTRGCPFKCNWCAKPIYGNRYNTRSPENVVAEIKMLMAKYQPSHFWFCDDIFGLKPGWIKKFSELVHQENLHFKFKIQCRVDLLLDENNIDHLAKAGCENIWVGAESGSQKILDAMDKGTKIGQIKEATLLMKKHGIEPAFFLQFGYLGETKDDIQKTISMLLDLMPSDVGISVSYPLPGTKFYEIVKGDLQKRTNWNDSNDLLMLFHSTYSASYYRQLHRYVHKRFRTAQGVDGLKKLLRNPVRLTRNEIRRITTLPWFLPLTMWNKLKLDFIVKR